ncbi:copper resistance CopC family protein [Nonomuraea jiangxiensis]|uniref:CopC domain-containing protein n=1 Tax=Nonomuraea jiangxiensis TaxID=633440 RepID=A0A1G8I4H5_9ACTN|nr:copper resistance protein CopC [Nonomuraea jiangxiensis]SDI13763.1 hypothetical protein SAMN05421869_104371 [Nonomuraea jiangxiensis]
MDRVASRLLAGAVLGLAALLLSVVAGGARPAFAHGRLAVSTPADGGRLAEPLEAVSLAFTEKPAPFAYFTVTAPNGDRVDRPWSHAEPFRLDEPVREYQLINGSWQPQLFHAGFPAKVPVGYWPGQGRYVVRYHTVASDGEEVKGEVRFTYTGPTTPAPPGWRAPADRPSPELAAAVGRVRGAPGQAPTAPASAGPAPPSTAASAAGSAPGPEAGTDVSAWVFPALLLLGAAVLLAGVARRRPSGTPPGPAPPGPQAGPAPPGPQRPADAGTSSSRTSQ